MNNSGLYPRKLINIQVIIYKIQLNPGIEKVEIFITNLIMSKYHRSLNVHSNNVQNIIYEKCLLNNVNKPFNSTIILFAFFNYFLSKISPEIHNFFLEKL